jgi:hypothetical protein
VSGDAGTGAAAVTGSAAELTEGAGAAPMASTVSVTGAMDSAATLPPHIGASAVTVIANTSATENILTFTIPKPIPSTAIAFPPLYT